MFEMLCSLTSALSFLGFLQGSGQVLPSTELIFSVPSIGNAFPSEIIFHLLYVYHACTWLFTCCLANENVYYLRSGTVFVLLLFLIFFVFPVVITLPGI